VGPRVAIASPRRGKEIDEWALRIVMRIQPSAARAPEPFDIERFYEVDLPKLTGVTTFYRKLSDGVYGYTHSETMVSCISIDLVDTWDRNKLRFGRSTMSHESGHCVVHVPEFRRRKSVLQSLLDRLEPPITMYRQEDIPTYRNPEWQAWRFGGALLMPTSTFEMAVRRGNSIRELGEIFDVHQPFIRARLRSLGLAAPE